MTAKQPAVKKYVVKLGAEERERFNASIEKGKAPARQASKADWQFTTSDARIKLKRLYPAI